MKKCNFIPLVAVGVLASSTWLGAQTEVPPPLEETAPVAPGATTESVDDATKATADSALKNFRTPGATSVPTTVETVETTTTTTTTTTNTAEPAAAAAAAVEAEAAASATELSAEDPIIPSPARVEKVMEQARDQAADAGVSQDNIDAAAAVVEDAVQKADDMSARDVEEAMKALEALGNQAKKSLEEAEVVATSPAEEGQARDVADTDPNAEMSLMPGTLPDSIPSDAAARASEVVRELGTDPEAMARMDAARSEIVTRVLAESEAKKAKLKFRRAFTFATNSAEAQALKDAAADAATDPEKRDLLRQYYGVVFAQVRKVEPGIKEYTDERESYYLRQIDAQVPPSTAISITEPVSEGKAKGAGDDVAPAADPLLPVDA